LKNYLTPSPADFLTRRAALRTNFIGPHSISQKGFKKNRKTYMDTQFKKHVGLHAKKFNFTSFSTIFLYLFSVCFETDLFVSVVSIWIRNTETNRNKPKKECISFAKQTENQPKQVEFRFVSVRTENFVCLFRGHPTCMFSLIHFEVLVSNYCIQKGEASVVLVVHNKPVLWIRIDLIRIRIQHF
jgi:hypothetical protein